jgi:NADP-dependent 3-hydroxy acid dehydrogenase YdfG
MHHPRTILITGATSGIGEALARAYAGPGVRLCLIGRDPERMRAVTEACYALGAETAAGLIDITDAAAIAQWSLRQDALRPFDLIIANAGISAGSGKAGVEKGEQARAILATNVDGVLNTIHPLIPLMCRRGAGQIALMSSLAGFRGMPGAPAYCASKAAVRVYGEALRLDLAPYGVGVSVICPGFVRSAMTAVNRFRMPFLMEADEAAHLIKKGLARNRPRLAFPVASYLFCRLLAGMPLPWSDRLLRRAPRKG